MNKLSNEKSEYLIQHSNNPVNWFPWGKEAFDKAKSEDKPIFLSIGYSSCHWCHVMEKESFEDIETAKILNQNFVSIKVDREERPDIDNVYMESTILLLTQRLEDCSHICLGNYRSIGKVGQLELVNI